MSHYIHLKTTNCIVCGKPATLWTGHVVARTYGPIAGDNRDVLKVSVTAGFCGDAKCGAVEPGPLGCFGSWKPKMGVQSKVGDA